MAAAGGDDLGGLEVSNGSSAIIWLIPIAFLVYMMWQQSRQRKRQQDMLAGLQIGDQVMTMGGMIGRIREIDDEIVQLEVADGVVVRIARGAISGRVGEEGPE